MATLSTSAYTSPDKCKAAVRANRHKTMTFNEHSFYQTLAYSFSTWDGSYHISVVVKRGYDSVYIQMPSGRTSMFTAAYKYNERGIMVNSPYMTYMMKDTFMIDHIDTARHGAYHVYFAYYGSHHVVSTLNTATQAIKYYHTSGMDSAFYMPVADIGRKLFWYDNLGNDSAYKYWNHAGILIAAHNLDTDSIFYDNGTLKTCEANTTIAGKTVRVTKGYSPSGALLSEEYHCNGQPCHIWRYYNGQGKLVRTETKTKVAAIPATSMGVVEAPPPDQVMIYVEQMPEYPGGMKQLKKDMDEKLAAILCQSNAPLDGVYKLQVMLKDDGAASYMQGEGTNIDRITQPLTQLFSTMPTWRPAKKNGSKATLIIRFEVKVQ